MFLVILFAMASNHLLFISVPLFVSLCLSLVISCLPQSISSFPPHDSALLLSLSDSRALRLLYLCLNVVVRSFEFPRRAEMQHTPFIVVEIREHIASCCD